MSTSLKDTTEVTHNYYGGRRAQVATRYLTSDKFGIRVVTMTWEDDATEANGGHPAGTIVKTVIRGDGRKDEGFEVFATEVIPPS